MRAHTRAPCFSTGQTTKATTTFVGDGGQTFHLDLTKDSDRKVYETLMKVQTTFQNLLNVERDNFIEMFPQFKKLRSAPEMFEEAPVETETYMEGELRSYTGTIYISTGRRQDHYRTKESHQSQSTH